MAMLQNLQLERTLWLMANEAGGAIVVDEAALNPLWDLKFERVAGAAPTLLRITASSLQEPSDGQIRKLASLLAGQPEDRTPSALLECGMMSLPPSYVVSRLAPLVRCQDGHWKSV